jgi:hypothetical protein
MSARPDLMAKLEKIVDVGASLNAGRLVPAEKQILREQSAAEQKVVAEHDRRPFDLCVTAGAEFGVIREMARAMEAEGDTPILTWLRDADGLIVGVRLVGHMARHVSTLGLTYEPVTP